MTRSVALSLLVVTGLGGCAEDETALLLSVCTNVRREQADRLVLEFHGDGAGDDEIDVRLADVGLPDDPYELSLRPGAQIDAGFTIVASLMLGAELVVTRRVSTAFVAGEDRDVRILLDSSCIDQFCGAGLTCDKGTCGPIGPGNDVCGPPHGQDGGPDGGGCDRDGDQYEGAACGGPDCDDDDFDVHPDAPELCDQRDNDCSGEADDGLWIAGSETYASLETTDEEAPAIAWGDGAYGISWRATRFCTTDSDCDGLACIENECGVLELRFVPLTPILNDDGRTYAHVTPSTTDQIVLSGDQPFAGEPSVAWSGIDWGLVYEDESSGPLAIFFARVDRSGRAIGFPVQVSFGNEGAYSPALAWSGRTWGAAWSEVVAGRSVLEFAQIDVDGFVTGGSALTPDGEDAFSAALDWGDNQFGVAWISGGGVVWFQRANDEGVPIGAPVQVSEADAFAGATVDVAWTGDGWALVWDQFTDGFTQIFLGRLDPEGVAEGAPGQVVQSGHNAVSPDLAWSGVELALVWADGNEGDAQVLLQRLSARGLPQGGPTRMIRSENARGSRPALSWSAETREWGVVWQDQRLATDTDVWFNWLYCDDGTR